MRRWYGTMGAQGVRKALDEAERPHETEAERRQAVRVAQLAWRSYQHFKGADLETRAMILDVWAHHKGSLIRLFWTNGDLPLVAEWQGTSVLIAKFAAF